MQFAFRFVIGGLLISTLPLVAASVGPRLAGILAMVPAVTLFGFAFLGLDHGASAVAQAARGALLGLAAVAAFLMTVAATSTEDRGVMAALAWGLAAWLSVALAIILVTRKDET